MAAAAMRFTNFLNCMRQCKRIARPRKLLDDVRWLMLNGCSCLATNKLTHFHFTHTLISVSSTRSRSEHFSHIRS